MADYFELVNRQQANVVGGFYAASAAVIKTGLLVKASADRSVALCSFTDKPDGFAEGLRQLVYAPTVLTLDAGEVCNLISGKLLIRVDSSFFYQGTLPTVGQTIYASNAGLMCMSGGVNKLGKCIKGGEADDVYRIAPNSTANTVLIDVTVGGYQTV